MRDNLHYYKKTDNLKEKTNELVQVFCELRNKKLIDDMMLIKKEFQKFLKICLKYLLHVQKSVFEGMITFSKLNAFKHEIEKVIDTEDDSVCIYEFENIKYMKKEQIGIIVDFDNII